MGKLRVRNEFAQDVESAHGEGGFKRVRGSRVDEAGWWTGQSRQALTGGGNPAHGASTGAIGNNGRWGRRDQGQQFVEGESVLTATVIHEPPQPQQ